MSFLVEHPCSRTHPQFSRLAKSEASFRSLCLSGPSSLASREVGSLDSASGVPQSDFSDVLLVLWGWGGVGELGEGWVDGFTTW